MKNKTQIKNVKYFFITQSYFVVPKDIRLNSTHYFIMKIPNKSELQQIMNLHKKGTAKPYTFLVIDSTLASDNLLHFRKNLLERI